MNRNQEINQTQIENKYIQLLEDTQKILENQLFILDSIHRRQPQVRQLETVWRYQMNSLTQFQRYQLYDQMKQLKSLLNLYKAFRSRISLYLVNEEKDIWEHIKELMDAMRQDFEEWKEDLDDSKIKEDFGRMMENKGTLILQKTQKKLKKEGRKILMEITGMTIKVLDVGIWKFFKVISCKLCGCKNLKLMDFFEHMLEHLSFLQIYDANLGRCMERNCNSKKHHRTSKFNLRIHLLENHSKCYEVERPLRYMMVNNLDEYGTNWKQYQYFKKDISKTLKIISPQYAEQFEKEYTVNSWKATQKEMYFKRRIKEAILQMDGEWRVQELGTLDSVVIYLATTWRKLFADPLMILDQGVPEMLSKLFSGRKIPYYDLQVKLLEAIIKGTQLDSLRVKLLLGYFNCSQTFGELELLIKDLEEALHGIAIFDCIMNEKMIGRECIFNDILCSSSFETVEEGLKHYCKSHIGIMACISNKGCELTKDDRIDTWIEHCHDQHKDDFVTLTQKYMKQQKVYFQFKAVCDRCSVKIQSLTDVYWVDDIFKPQLEWKMEIRIRWRDLIRSYNEERQLDDECALKYEEQYKQYKKSILEGIGMRRTINNNGKIAVCKNCKNKKKKQQMTHLKKEQFQMRDTNRLFALVRIEGKITRKASDTFFRVIGNLNALKEKPHIFFAGTDILYEWNSTQAKKQFKCRLMGKSEAERTDYVNACQNHTFLVNHTYQMTDLSQQLLRQEKQILEVNKNLWMRYLDKEQVSNAKDKLQLEFAKMQDMLLFDGLLHKTSVKFVCGRMKQPFRQWMREFGQFLGGNRVAEHQYNERCIELLDMFLNCSGEEKQFWEMTMLCYFILEQRDDSVLDFGNSMDSLPELLLMNREWNIFGDWIRMRTLLEVRAFVDNCIHPIYMGVFYQYVVKNYSGKNRLNQKQRRIVEVIFQGFSLQIIDTCLLNHGYTTPDANNTFFQAERQEIWNQQQYLLYEMMDLLDDQQFIDMQGRIALVNKAIEDTLGGHDMEDIMPSDLRWTVQIASIFLSSLKAQKTYFHGGPDRDTCMKHLEEMKGLEDEIEYFYARNDPVYNQDFLTTTYREVILEIVDNEIFPMDQFGMKRVRQFTQQEIRILSRYENLRKLHFVFWIPVEQKLRNLLNVHKVLRELADKEPYFQMSTQLNVTSFYKELEYAMFPNLYPNAQGGLVTKVPEVKQFQLMVDLIEQEKLLAPYHLQQLAQIRQNVVRRQIDRNQLMNSNDLDIEIALVDFNVREQFGNTTYKPTKAIYKFLKQPIINSNQSLAYILELQQLAPLQYEQQRNQLQQSGNQEWILPQIANLQIKVNNNIGSQSILENHVSQNLDKYLKEQQVQWDNEQQQFVRRQEQEVERLRAEGRNKGDIEGFLMLQKKLLIETKIKQLASNNSLTRALDALRNTNVLSLDDSVTTSESEEEEREKERTKQMEKALDEVNQFNRRVLNDVFGRHHQQQQPQNNQNQIDVTRREINELIDLDKQKVDLSVDTKFKLTSSFTENFQKDHKWILWRYYEWIKSQFYCYQKIVNKERGVTVYQQGEQKKFSSIPPICGSDTELQERYKEIRAYCFQEGPPLIMLTITANEFDEKTFKVMRGLNIFDLEDEETTILANKRISRDDDINGNANLYVQYYVYLVDHLLKGVLNSFAESQKSPNYHWDKCSFGMFGKIKTYVKRIEFQERGSIHFHILLFFEPNEEGLYDEKLLLYLKGILSSYRMGIQKDKEFIQKHNLLHRCNANRCTKADNLKCKEGFPFQITYGYVNANYPVEVKQRRLTLEDSNVISYWKFLVKYFNSNVQLQITADERIISYIMKYINKKKTQQDVGKSEDVQEEFVNQEEKQIMDLIEKFYKDKITHLQEACLAFQSEKILETTYKVVKINQVPLSRQQQNVNEVLEGLAQENVEEQFNWKNKANVWNRYLKRPSEFIHFNLIEYVLNCLYYGKKSTYIKKYNQERENQNLKIEDYKYFIDQDGGVVKLKETAEKKMTIIVKTLLYSTEEYGQKDNIFFLEMLQLYWPHRYQEWISLTKDNYDGYREAYTTLLETYEYPESTDNPLAIFFKNKYCKFQPNPLSSYSEQHKNIRTYQRRMLEVMYRHKFNLQYNENNEKNVSNIDYMFQIKQMLAQQLDLEFGYRRVDQIRSILDVFNPKQDKADQELLDKANQLMDDLELEVRENWLELPQSTQHIISSVAQLFNFYGCPEIQQEIAKYKDTGAVKKSLAVGKDLYLSQKLLTRQSIENKEEGEEMEIPVNKPEQRSQKIQEEIPSSLILEEKLDDVHIRFEGLYKNKLTVEEYNRTKIQKQIKRWNTINMDDQLHLAYQNLNLQQRFAFFSMIINLTMTFKEEERDRKFEGTFVHGPGGVGKSHLIATVVKFADNFNLRYDILCPTQFSAQNIMKMCEKLGVKDTRVETIHSFFNLRIDQGIKSHMHAFWNHIGKQGVLKFTRTTEIYQKFIKFQFVNFSKLVEVFRELDMIIIEEVSMMDPDFLTLLDIYGQISRQCAYPFGGIQVFLFGDSFQLQPVMQGKTNYFDSHVFKSGYFTHMIELTQSVRQAEDLEYFEKILQPIRFGTFGEDANNFYEQIQNLQKRVVSERTFGTNQMVKSELEEKKKKNEQVISLFFKNENVEHENQRRALQIIQMIDEKRNKGYTTQKKRFRQYIKLPIQFRWSNQKSEEDRMALLLGQKYQFKKEVYEANFNYQTHYLMLPIGIRNYVASQMGEIAYRIGIKREEINKSSCLKELTLFEGEEIIIRKNIEKQRNLINGQFATIKGLEFDVDYTGAYNMRELEKEQSEYIGERNYFGMLEQIKNQKMIRFSEDDKKEMNKILEEKHLMNINSLYELDVHQSEKGMIYLQGVEPRLWKINLKIAETQMTTLELGDKAYSHLVNVQKTDLIRTLTEMEDELLTTHEFVLKTLQRNPSWQLAAQRIKQWIVDNGQMDMFGIDYVNGQFGLEYLERCLIHMKFLIRKLPSTLQVQISQIPINLGYARTIHCAQGSTLDNVIMDLDMPERQQSGLLYTALSRVRRISNLYLSGKFDQNMFKVRVSEQIKKFYGDNIIQVPKYLTNDQLKEFLEKDLKEQLEIINEIAQDQRQVLIQLKQDQMKIQNH